MARTAPVYCGYEAASGLYYEVLGVGGDSSPPCLFIHGGSGTAAVFRVTPDGRAGWAELLAADGHPCWLADWPGMGRSGGPDIVDVDANAVVDGFASLLRDVIGVPTLIVCHSAGGSIAWRLAELAREYVAGIVALSPSNPGNIGPRADVVERSSEAITLRHPQTGIHITVRTDQHYIVTRETVTSQWIGTSTRFPLEHIDAFRHSLVPMPPKLVLQRLGAHGGMPSVADTSTFEALWVRIVVPANDPARTLENTLPLVDLFRSWGADGDVIDLAGRGIAGNGHFMFCELNSDEVLDLVLNEVKGHWKSHPVP